MTGDIFGQFFARNSLVNVLTAPAYLQYDDPVDQFGTKGQHLLHTDFAVFLSSVCNDACGACETAFTYADPLVSEQAGPQKN